MSQLLVPKEPFGIPALISPCGGLALGGMDLNVQYGVLRDSDSTPNQGFVTAPLHLKSKRALSFLPKGYKEI